MLENHEQAFPESQRTTAYQSRTVEILTGTAGLLVTALSLYLLFFDRALGF